MTMNKKQKRASPKVVPSQPKQKLHLLRGAPSDADLEKIVDELIAVANPPGPARRKK